MLSRAWVWGMLLRVQRKVLGKERRGKGYRTVRKTSPSRKVLGSILKVHTLPRHPKGVAA